MTRIQYLSFCVTSYFWRKPWFFDNVMIDTFRILPIKFRISLYTIYFSRPLGLFSSGNTYVMKLNGQNISKKMNVWFKTSLEYFNDWHVKCIKTCSVNHYIDIKSNFSLKPWYLSWIEAPSFCTLECQL